LYTTKPETGPLQSRTPKELPEIVSADEKKSRYNTTITELTNETKTTGRHRHVVYESKEKKPPQNTALLYQCRLFQAHRNPPTPPNVRKKKKKTNH